MLCVGEGGRERCCAMVCACVCVCERGVMWCVCVKGRGCCGDCAGSVCVWVCERGGMYVCVSECEREHSRAEIEREREREEVLCCVGGGCTWSPMRLLQNLHFVSLSMTIAPSLCFVD